LGTCFGGAIVAKKITLSNGRTFTTQKAAGEFYREILWRYAETYGEPIAEHDDMFALVTHHPEADAKIGCGISHFTVEHNLNCPGFWVHRPDGTSTDFSYKVALTGAPKTPYSMLQGACRAVVKPDIQAFKLQYFGGGITAPCQVTGVSLTIDVAHVDHEKPKFVELVDEFRQLRGWVPVIPREIIAPSIDGQMRAEFADPEVGDMFRAFHKTRATLRVTSKEFDLSRG
jgi:Protein of unknown function (DUF3223)